MRTGALAAFAIVALAAGGCAGTQPPGAPPDSRGAVASGAPAGAADGSPRAMPSIPLPTAPAATPPATPPVAPATGAPAQSAAVVAGRAETAEASADDELPLLELTPPLMFQLLAAEVAAQRGDPGRAAATYLSMARQTLDPRIAKRATELALAERSLERAIGAAELWRELSPQSSSAARTAESLWIRAGRWPEAEKLLRARLDAARAAQQLPQAYRELPHALARSQDRQGALAMLERLAAPDAQLPAARLALAAVAEAAGDPGRALAEAQAAMTLDPASTEAAVAAARYTSQSAPGTTGAIALLRSFIARQPAALEARIVLARLLTANGRPGEARTELDAALARQPQNPALLYLAAQAAHQAKQPRAAEAYLQRFVGLPPEVARDQNAGYLFLGQIAEESGRTQQAIDWFAKVADGDALVPALARRALLLARLGRIDEARALLRAAQARNPREHARLASAEAQALREAGRDAEAFETLEQALQQIPDDPDLLYDHAMAAERADRIDVTEASLRRLIALRPDNAHAWNALGYTLADRNLRLDEAQAMIAKALELEPGNAHIVDSMGWVLFRRGDLEGAIEQLQKAYRLRPEAEIAAHLGEALWKAGRQEEARRVWQEAAAREPRNKVLEETLARHGIGR